MNYLNLHTDLLRSETYLGAEPLERATWLNLMGWCASQENGGVIVGASEWTDRKWQQLCGVTKEEATLVSELYHFDEDGNMVVNLYPIEKETEVKTKRETAKANGKKGGRPPKKTKKKPTTETDEKPTSVNFAKAEGNGREGNGKESKEGEARTREDAPPTESHHPNPNITEAIAWINSIRESWAKTPHLTAAEMHDLAQSADAICALDEQVLCAVAAYAVSPPGKQDWALNTRGRFIANYTEVVQRALEYESQPLSTTTGMGGRKARKVTDLRNTTQHES